MVPLSKISNVATITSTLGFITYDSFCKEAEIMFSDKDNNPIVADESMFNNDESFISPYKTPNNTRLHPLGLNLNLFSSRSKIPDPAFCEIKQIKDEAALLQYHQDFGHISF